jgi:hypothetical protein
MLMATDSTRLHQAKGRAIAENIGVFVSHHHSPEEDAFTARLVADLEAAGADVWVDYQGIASGSFVQKINEGLSGRQWLVLVMTPASLGSRWVQDEVNAALHQVNGGRMRGVIPLVMTPCDEALIPPLWAQLHRYDATKDYEVARDGLLRAIGLSLPSAKDVSQSPRQEAMNEQGGADATVTQAGVSQKDQHLDIARIKTELDLARLKTLDGLLSLTSLQFEDAVALILADLGYHNLGRPTIRSPSPFPGGHDLHGTAPDGRFTYVWCMAYKPDHPVDIWDVSVTNVAVKWQFLTMIVTTSRFTSAALDFAKSRSDQITLVDGKQLVSMMQRVQPD